LAYTTIAEVQKIAVYKDGTSDGSGKTAQAIATADLAIKARIKAAGLTPPTSDDILNVASQFLARSILRRTKREEGSMPISMGDSYDATNRAVDADVKFAYEKVDEYIRYTIAQDANMSTDGQTRADAVGTQFKLDQGNLGSFE